MHPLSNRRRGFSLLEVIMASALASIALVGALAMLRDGLAVSQTIDERSLMTNYAVSKLEEQMVLVAASWTSGSASGNFAADGHTSIRYSVTRSDAVANGGLVDRLMHIQVTTFVDIDGDGVLDANEKRCYLRTKVGKFVTYEALGAP